MFTLTIREPNAANDNGGRRSPADGVIRTLNAIRASGRCDLDLLREALARALVRLERSGADRSEIDRLRAYASTLPVLEGGSRMPSRTASRVSAAAAHE